MALECGEDKHAKRMGVRLDGVNLGSLCFNGTNRTFSMTIGSVCLSGTNTWPDSEVW